MRGRFSTPAGRAALGGVLAAGGLAVLWLASVAPTGRLLLAAQRGGLYTMTTTCERPRPLTPGGAPDQV